MKLIILDRDGVINYDSVHYIKTPAEWIPIPGSLDAIAQLTQAGFTLTVATNQSGIARGLYTRQTLDQIHAKMHAAVTAQGGKIDTVFYCPHCPDDYCNCRKPKTGLLEQIAAHYHIPLQGIPLIGDSLRDMQAAQRMGCKAILVGSGNGTAHKTQYATLLTDVPFYPNLAAVVTSGNLLR